MNIHVHSRGVNIYIDHSFFISIQEEESSLYKYVNPWAVRLLTTEIYSGGTLEPIK